MAINGTVGGVSETFQEGGTARKFAAMVSDSLFVPGANRLDLYLVKAGATGTVLSPVRTGG